MSDHDYEDLTDAGQDAIADGADPQKVREIEQATRETLDQMGARYEVDVKESSVEDVITELLWFSMRPVGDWVDGLHESMVDPGKGRRTDVSVALGSLCGKENGIPDDIYELVNKSIEANRRQEPDDGHEAASPNVGVNLPDAEAYRVECENCGYAADVTEGASRRETPPKESAKKRRAGHIGYGCSPGDVTITVLRQE